MTVMIGIDPHKRTHTAVAIGGRDRTLDQLRVVADRRQIPKLLAWADQFDERRWAARRTRPTRTTPARPRWQAGTIRT